MTFWVLTFIAEMLEVKGTLYFFDTFMEKRDGGYRNRYRFFVYCGVLYLVAVTGAWIGMLKCIPIILVMSFLNLAYYEVSFRQSFLFSIINYTMLVLIDYVTVLLGRGGSIQEKWFLQALISKTVFIILMLFIRRFSKWVGHNQINGPVYAEERFLQYIMEHQKKNVMLRCGVLVITMGMVGRFLMISQKIVFGSAE